MINLQKHLATGFPRTRKLFWIALILCLVLSVTLAACSSNKGPAVDSLDAPVLSQNELEAQHGLRVTLVAVTAAGGLVDLRLKFVDGDKVKALLESPENFPTLWVAGKQVTLTAPEDGRPEEIKFDNDANLFLMYPNTANAVEPGTSVTIVFGSVRVGPIEAK